MPQNKTDYVSEQGYPTVREAYQTPEKVNKVTFTPGMVKKPNFGKDIPVSNLASDDAGFDGPVEATFTQNAGKHSEGGNNNFNGPFKKSTE